MPALFDHLRHPPRLSAGFHRHAAAWNASEILPESFLFHPQPELLAHFAARIQNADIAVFVAQIDSDEKAKPCLVSVLPLLAICFLLVFSFIAGLLFAPRVRL
jgi:hypothetical protein